MQHRHDNAFMSAKSPPVALHAFETLTPDLVMDALASVGLYGDGRLLALSSYENRVYQVHLEDAQAVVAKFYRPQRWSEAQILEEHALAAELMAAEIPAVGPCCCRGEPCTNLATLLSASARAVVAGRRSSMMPMCWNG